MDAANDLALAAWLEGGGDVGASSDAGFTVLMGAAASGNVKLVRELLSRGCAVNQQDPITRRTALMAACSGGAGDGSSDGVVGAATPQPQVARLLLEHGAKVDLRSAAGKTALDELAEATRSRVLGPLEFTRMIECTKVVAGHLQAQEEATRQAPKLVGNLTHADELAFEAWVKRVEHEQVALLKLCEENRRRGMDHEGRLTTLVSEASGRHLLDRTKDAAMALKRGRTRAIDRDLKAMGLL